MLVAHIAFETVELTNVFLIILDLVRRALLVLQISPIIWAVLLCHCQMRELVLTRVNGTNPVTKIQIFACNSWVPNTHSGH